jgi:RNA polymerase sigma-70 factor (ECF subfamily)
LDQQRENSLEREILKLYDLYAPSLLCYANTLVRDPEVAQDAVQEAFLRCALMLSAERRISNPKPWLFRVLRNYLLDLMKSSHTKNEIGMDQFPDVLDQGGNPEEQYASAQMYHKITSALTLREFECLRLRSEGFRYSEIAERLSIRPGTVAALLSRCSVRVKELMGRTDASAAVELPAEEPYAS